MAENDWVSFIQKYIRERPYARPADVYKLLYQAHFGPRHYIEYCGGVSATIVPAFKNAPPEKGRIIEYIDPDLTVYRINLGAYKFYKGTAPRLVDAVKRTIEEIFADVEPDGFRKIWESVSAMLEADDRFDEEEIKILDAAASKNPPAIAHHSTSFIEAENPDYIVAATPDFARMSSELKNTAPMPDVQNGPPEHPLDIDKVGIRGLSYPIVVLDKQNERQHTVADITMSVELPAKWRGTHMSRFLELLEQYHGEITYVQIRPLLDEMRKVFDARAAHIILKFPYFIEKKAPVSKAPSLMEYTATFDGELDDGGFRFKVGIGVPITTLCPCSKEISDHGAHSQRAYVEITALSESFVWFEDLIEIAEYAASSPVYSLLKREDEKFITERAYEKPRFVEDVARAVARELEARQDIAEFDVRVISHESIHNHDAFAEIRGYIKEC